MSFRNKLNRLKPHISNEHGSSPLSSRNVQEFPNKAIWEKESVTPYYYDDSYCLIREKEFSVDEQYGKYRFSQFLQAIELWNRTSFHHPLSAKGYEPEELFFFDTETTGLGGGTGNTIFLLGHASFKGEKIILRQHLLPHPGAEVPFYQSFLEGIDYRTLVTYNGKAFDWPQVKTRHTLVREHVPKLPAFGHFDLFHAARRLWKHKLERVKLSIVEKEVLGVERKDDIPGFLAPMIYFDFVESKNPDGMLGILKHNEMDILSLITLYTHITFQLLNVDEERTVSEGYEVGRWYASLGETAAATENLSLYTNLDDGASMKAKFLLSLERKKQRQWEEACRLWEELILTQHDQLSFKANIELAKYYEHRKKEFNKALNYTKKAVEVFEKTPVGIGRKEDQLSLELEKRLKRIKRKLEK